jgi:hypothetical protein
MNDIMNIYKLDLKIQNNKKVILPKNNWVDKSKSLVKD